jgi:hypothetical protein
MALVKSVDKGSVGGFVGIMGSGQILHAKKGQWALQKICPPRPDRRRFLTSHATALRKPAKNKKNKSPSAVVQPCNCCYNLSEKITHRPDSSDFPRGAFGFYGILLRLITIY